MELKPSPALAAAIVAAHGAAAACVLAVAPGWQGAALAILVAALGVAAACNRALLLGTRAPRVIEIAPSALGEIPADGARLIQAGGLPTPALPVRGVGVTRWWVALRTGRGGILVCAGMLDSESFRRLRVWALWERVPPVARGQLQG